MADYHLLTIWRIDAPLTQVYEVILDSLHWPQWWSGVEKVEQTAVGDHNGINSIRRYSWQGDLPYPLVLEVCATRIEALVVIEGDARGDLEGTGRWQFAADGKVSVVHFEWHVRSTRWWMNLLAPLARPMFIRNHAQVMALGGEGLARRLGTTLLSQDNIDLTPGNGGVKGISQPLWQAGWINPLMLLSVGLGAGTLATLVQMILWWLTGIPILETLFRDARLTAALLMGPDVLPPPSTLQWDILLVASLIHFALSIACALLPCMLVSARQTAGPVIIGGALYGLGIYGVNLYGFTLLFPWFSVTRGWVTLLTHLVFGMALTTGCRCFARDSRKAKLKMLRDVRST